MGCSCGKSRSREAVRGRSTSSASPMLVGEPNGVTVEARTSIRWRRFPRYARVWLTGDGVDRLVSAGVVTLVE